MATLLSSHSTPQQIAQVYTLGPVADRLSIASQLNDPPTEPLESDDISGTKATTPNDKLIN